MLPTDFEAKLAPPAQLIKAERRHRSDQGETGQQREHQGQHFVATGDPGHDQRQQRIDHDEQQDMARLGIEVVEPLHQHFDQIGKLDLADRRLGAVGLKSTDRGFIRHRLTPELVERPRSYTAGDTLSLLLSSP